MIKILAWSQTARGEGTWPLSSLALPSSPSAGQPWPLLRSTLALGAPWAGPWGPRAWEGKSATWEGAV